jgi:hypothetical protein
MKTFRATVVKGRLTMNEPTDLPDGMELQLVLPDDWDDLDEAQRVALHASLDDSLQQIEDGHTRPVEELIRDLRARR